MLTLPHNTNTPDHQDVPPSHAGAESALVWWFTLSVHWFVGTRQPVLRTESLILLAELGVSLSNYCTYSEYCRHLRYQSTRRKQYQVANAGTKSRSTSFRWLVKEKPFWEVGIPFGWVSVWRWYVKLPELLGSNSDCFRPSFETKEF